MYGSRYKTQSEHLSHGGNHTFCSPESIKPDMHVSQLSHQPNYPQASHRFDGILTSDPIIIKTVQSFTSQTTAIIFQSIYVWRVKGRRPVVAVVVVAMFSGMSPRTNPSTYIRGQIRSIGRGVLIAPKSGPNARPPPLKSVLILSTA